MQIHKFQEIRKSFKWKDMKKEKEGLKKSDVLPNATRKIKGQLQD